MMTKSAHGFQDFRLNDLTGGINTRDYPSEIEDKQMLELTNWNFKGNKLVSEKGIENIYTSEYNIPIQGMTVDGGDIWHIEGGNLYKNGAILFSANAYVLTVGNIDGEIFSMNIEGTDYVFKFGWNNNEELARTQFETELQVILPGATYNVNYNGDGTYSIDRIDGGAITFANPNLVREIELNDWNEHTKIDITIDTTTTTIDGIIYPNANDALDYVISQLPLAIYETNSASGGKFEIARIDATVPAISSTTYDRYTYDLWGENRNNGYWMSSSDADDELDLVINIDGGVLSNTGSPGIVYNNLTFSGGCSDGGENDNVNTIHGVKRLDMVYDRMGASYTKTPITRISCSSYSNPYSGTIDQDRFGFSYNKNDYTQSSLIQYSEMYDLVTGNYQTSNWFSNTETINTTTITVGTYGEVNHIITDDGGLGLKNYGLYNIYVSSYGILVYSRNTNEQSDVLNNPKQIFIDLTTGIVTDIPSSISEPSVGTIYNGKLIFGGYYKTDLGFYDGITFSETEDPVLAGNEMLDFTGYSAGSQSVSSGNKGRITGMLEGENGLYVFKDDSIYYTNTEKDTGTSFNFIFNKITSNGALNQQCITEVEQEVLFYDHKTRAIRRLGYERNLTTLRDVAVSREIEDILQAIPDNTSSDNYSSLINGSFNYPLYKLNITTSTSPEVYIDIDGTKDSWKFRAPNKTIIYNVENKSWTIKTYTGNNLIHSYKGYIATNDGKIYRDDIGNTLEEGNGLSKEYTFIDDVDYKRIGELEVSGKVIGDGGDKTFEIEILVDGENLEIGEEPTLNRRIITATDGETITFNEKIDLYDDGQKFQFKPIHNGNGRVELSDVNVRLKALKTSSEYY